MDYRAETFLCVCRHMNYTRAAEELCLTQPAVSQHIRGLERQYEVKLFRQEGRQIKLTRAGEILRSTLTVIQNDEAVMMKRMRESEEPVRRQTFGVTMTIGEYAVAEPLSRYLANHPDTNIRVRVGNTAELLSELEEGKIDFALVEGYCRMEDYDHLIFSTEEFIPICSARHQFQKTPKVLADLLPERLIVREEGSGTRSLLERKLALADLKVDDFRRSVLVENMHTILRLVENDCGISFLYRVAAADELAAGTVREIRLKDFTMYHDFAFVWEKRSAFAQEYREVCMEMLEEVKRG